MEHSLCSRKRAGYTAQGKTVERGRSPPPAVEEETLDEGHGGKVGEFDSSTLRWRASSRSRPLPTTKADASCATGVASDGQVRASRCLWRSAGRPGAAVLHRPAGPVREELELLRAAADEECHVRAPASGTRTVSPLARGRCGERSAATGPEMAFEALVLGDGSRVGDKRIQLAPSRLHASPRAFAEAEQFYAVEAAASIFDGDWRGEVRLDAYAVKGTSAFARAGGRRSKHVVVPAEEDTPLTSAGLSRQEVAELVVLQFLFAHPGFAVILHGVGSREPVSWSQGDKVHVPGLPLVGEQRLSCVKSAIVNAVASLIGENEGKLVYAVVKADGRRWRNLRSVGAALTEANQRKIGCFALGDKALNRALKTSSPAGTFAKFMEMGSGVYVVRLHQQDGNDHAVAVDFHRGIIIDSEEAGCIRLTVDNLRRCAGPEKKAMRIFEVREIVPSKK